MSFNNHYGGVIWTNHALKRLYQRGLKQEKALEAFHSPDRTLIGKKSGTSEFQKRFGPSFVTIIATKNDHNEWIILSCWIDPPLPGSVDAQKKDAYKTYQKASFWKKFWIVLRQQIGI